MAEKITNQPPKNDLEPDKVAELDAYVQDWMPELRRLLPDLPEDPETTFNKTHVIKLTGVGGHPPSPNQLELSFDPDFDGDKQEQLVNFRGMLFHESYHIIQGYVGENSRFKGTSFITQAILEGAATKFEVIRAGTSPGWSKYPADEIDDWFRELLNMEYTPDGNTWEKIKFYDPERQRAWMLYKVGCYVIDEALRNSQLEIEDLATMDPEQILKLSRLTESSE